MTLVFRPVLLASTLLVGLLSSLAAAENPKEIRVDWAKYNPVSMLLKDKSFLQQELVKDGIGVRWLQTPQVLRR